MMTTVKKIKSIVFMFFVLTAFMGSAQSADESSGLEISDLDGAWFKVKTKSKGFCELGDGSLDKEKYSEKGYLYLSYQGGDFFSGVYVYLDDEKVWRKASDNVSIQLEIGNMKKAILEVYFSDSFSDDDYVEWSYTLFLTTKEKKGELKSAKLKTLSSYEYEVDEDGECYLTPKLSGKTVKAEKVPEDVLSIVSPF